MTKHSWKINSGYVTCSTCDVLASNYNQTSHMCETKGQSHHHLLTTTISPPQTHHHNLTITISPPPSHHYHRITTISPQQSHHHNLTTTLSPPHYQHLLPTIQNLYIISIPYFYLTTDTKNKLHIIWIHMMMSN